MRPCCSACACSPASPPLHPFCPQALQDVAGDIMIRHNPRLKSLAGLSGLVNARREVGLVDNAQLTTTAGLSNLTSVGARGSAHMQQRQRALHASVHLPACMLHTCRCTLGCEHTHSRSRSRACSRAAPLLPCLHLPPCCPAFTGVSVVVMMHPALRDLAGFGRLTAVPGDLQLFQLPSLTSLRDLAALQTVGLNLVLSANNGLTSLEGLGESQHGHGSRQQHCGSSSSSSSVMARRRRRRSVCCHGPA